MHSSHLPLSAVALERGEYDRRRTLNAEYLRSLRPAALLQNHYLEAGIGDQGWHLHPSSPDARSRGLERHWGWETPGSLLRGHFVGHWLSAAAREVAVTGDAVLRAHLGEVLDGLERCQREIGDGWVFATPPAFLDRLARGLDVWAPQYAMHKTLMGLVDVARDLHDDRALRIAHDAGQWMSRWAREFTEGEFQRILETETGGMLEVWADLLDLTGDELYRDLLERYYHSSLFDALLAGRDALTNMHANTTIPEVLGAARAYEVTGDERWRRVVEAYWDWAVTRRGTFCTGGQTSGEIWTPPFEFAARRGEKTQEHCAVYNMIRLADVLYRWTGDALYLDYIERNLLNGILAQQHPATGMVAYFLPLKAGSRKEWGSPTEDFWCCHGTLVQAHTRHSAVTFYRGAGQGELTIAQFIPASARLETEGNATTVRLEVLGDDGRYVGPDSNAGELGDIHRPRALRARIVVESDVPTPLRIRVRVPEWAEGEYAVESDVPVTSAGGFAQWQHSGAHSVVEIAFPLRLRSAPIPDEPGTVAFLEGATVLAGMVDREVTLRGSADDPDGMLAPDDERHWSQWRTRYRYVGGPESFTLAPLRDIADEAFTVYFPVRETDG